MKRKKGFTLVELIVTMTIVSVLASAFVSLFVPQIMLLFFVPLENRVQTAAADAMSTMIEGDRFARGLKYAEPDNIAKQIFIAPQDNDTQRNFTGSILYADPVTVRYGYHDLNRVFHNVELRLNTTNKTLERKIDAGAYTVISGGGAPETGGFQIFTGGANGDGAAAVFRYYRKDFTLSYDDQPDPEMTGFSDSLIPAQNLPQICRVDISYRVNTGGNQVMGGQSEILKSSGARVRAYILPESNEWDLSFYQHPGEISPRILGVKKNAADIWVCSLRGDGWFWAGTGFTVTMNLANRGDNYTYLMADCATATDPPDGVPDLVEIRKNMFNATAQMELRIYDGNRLETATLLRPAITLPVANINGYEQYGFQMADYNGDGRPDLYIIAKGRNGAALRANFVTVYVYSGADFTTQLRMVPRNMGTAMNSNWKFLVTNWNYILDPDNPPPAGQADSCPDLVAIRQKGGASGTVEVSVFRAFPVTLAAPQACVAGNAGTAFAAAFNIDGALLSNVRSARGSINLNNVDFGVGEWPFTFDSDGHPDILLVQRNPTDSGSAEFHSMSNYAEDGSGISLLTPTTTIFDQLTPGNDAGMGIGIERDIGSGKSVQ